MNAHTPLSTLPSIVLSDVETRLVRMLRSLRFGSIDVQVHDSRIVQIECSERVRFDGKNRDKTSL